MTHAELVRLAVRWLKARRCDPVMTRGSVMVTEQPDALGWLASGRSLLVECKATRQDFRRDRQKAHRVLADKFPSKGMGNLRYYLAPAGLLAEGEVSEGWGLLEARGGRVRVAREAPFHPQKFLAEELRLLVALTRHGSGVVDEAELSLVVTEGVS